MRLKEISEPKLRDFVKQAVPSADKLAAQGDEVKAAKRNRSIGVAAKKIGQHLIKKHQASVNEAGSPIVDREKIQELLAKKKELQNLLLSAKKIDPAIRARVVQGLAHLNAQLEKQGVSESVFVNDKNPKLLGLSFKDLERLSESAGNDYSKFDRNISKNINLPKHKGIPSNTLNLYAIYRKQKFLESQDKKLSDIESKLFNTFKSRGTSTNKSIKVGDSVSVLMLSTLLIPDEKIIARLEGFLSPKEIHAITHANNIDYLHFTDGTKFPDTDNDDPVFLTQTWAMTKLFDSYDSASRAFMFYAAEGDKLSKQVQFNIKVDTSKNKERDVSEESYDPTKQYGVRYKVFAGREHRLTTKEAWFKSHEALERGVEKIKNLGNFYEIDGYSIPTNKGEPGVLEGVEQKMSVPDIMAYLKKVMGTESHQDWRNDVINNNEYFVLKNIPVNSLWIDLPGLDKANVEKYKQMDFSKAPPIVIGSDGNIIDGYHRANVAKALKVPTLKAWVGVKKKGVSEGLGNAIKSWKRGREADRKSGEEWKKAADAEKAGDKAAADKHFKRHTRYHNLTSPNQWQKVSDEQGVTEGLKLPKYEYGKVTRAYKLAKQWLAIHGNNGYKDFEFPEYAGMPKNITNKLTTDEVDFIQKHWNQEGVSEGIPSGDRPIDKLHTALVWNRGADRLKQQYEKDNDVSKLIASIQKLAKVKYKMSINKGDAKWIAKDLVYPAILEQDVEEGAEEQMRKEVEAMAKGKCPHCDGPVLKKEWPTLTQYHCPKCKIRASKDKEGVSEGSKYLGDRRKFFALRNKSTAELDKIINSTTASDNDKELAKRAKAEKLKPARVDRTKEPNRKSERYYANKEAKKKGSIPMREQIQSAPAEEIEQYLDDAAENISQAIELLRQAARLGRKAPHPFSGQLQAYIIPHLESWIENENQPGSIASLKRILYNED